MNNIEKKFSMKMQNAAAAKTKKKHTLQLVQHNLYVIKTENIFCNFLKLFAAAEISAEIALTLKFYYIFY